MERELLRAILGADYERVAELMAPLTEKERAALVEPVDTLQRRLRVLHVERDRTPLNQKKPYGEFASDLAPANQWAMHRAAVLALFGLVDSARVHEADGLDIFRFTRIHPEDWPVLIRILRERRPRWLDGWIKANLQPGEFVDRMPIVLLDTMVQEGVCARPTWEGYYWALCDLYQICARTTLEEARPTLRLSDELRARPELLDGVWGLFDREIPEFVPPRFWERMPLGEETWPVALRVLADEGAIDRLQLLGACLTALTRDFKQPTVSGYMQFFEGIEPYSAELAALQQPIFDLLSAGQDRVVAFAITLVKRLNRAKMLDDGLWVASVAPVFRCKSKGTVKGALTVLKAVGKRAPDRVPAILALAVEDGLAHPETDVQKAVLDLISAWEAKLTPELRCGIAGHGEHLAPTLRPVAAKLSGAATVPAEPDVSVESSAPSPGEGAFDNLKRRASSLAKSWRTLAGVDEALDAAARGAAPPPLTFAMADVPFLDSLSPVAPIGTVEELLDTVSQNYEKCTSGMDIERILDGVSRLGLQRSADFERRAAPLLKRLRTLVHPRLGLMGMRDFSIELDFILRQWLTGKPLDFEGLLVPPQYFRDRFPSEDTPGIALFVEERLISIRENLEQGVAPPLLAMPTHEGGWIDPAVLVERLHECAAMGYTPHRYDAIQALLRLASASRPEALERIRELDDPIVRAVRWFLGDGEVQPRPNEDGGLWLAAGRARNPFDDFTQFLGPCCDAPGPDGLVPATYHWTVQQDEAAAPRIDRYRAHSAAHREPGYEDVDFGWVYMRDHPSQTRLSLDIVPGPVASAHDTAHPTSLLLERWTRVLESEAVEIAWRALVWPANEVSFLGFGLQDLVSGIDKKGPAQARFSEYFAPLLLPDRPLGNEAAMALVLGMAHANDDLRIAASDVVVQAIDDGRLPAPCWFDALAQLSRGYWFKVARLCQSMATLAGNGVLHAWIVTRSLERLAQTSGKLEKEGAPILAPLLEIVTEYGFALEPDTAEALKALKGSGKSAKLAKQLLGLTEREGAMRGVMTLLAEVRIKRAERWAQNN